MTRDSLRGTFTPDPAVVRSAVEEALTGARLLDHPFYRRWEQGLLELDELAAYAMQYRHVERALPAILESVASGLPHSRSRALVEANLADERGDPERGQAAHAELFESFAAAVSASDVAPASSATAELVQIETDAASRDPATAIAMLAAYEIQAAAVASTKAEGLRRHYGLGDEGTEFWDVHAELEERHGSWSIEALASLGASPEEVRSGASAAAGAWWRLLDEREGERQSAAMPASTAGSLRDN
jgi:pyrroloquinoline-quinone synthase